MKNKENKIREDLVLKLNEIGSDEILILFNDFLGNSLDEHINGVIKNWDDEEFKEFLVYAEKNKKFIEVITNY